MMAFQVPAHPHVTTAFTSTPLPVRASLLHPQATSPAPSTHLRLRITHAARCRCPLSVLTARYPPLTFGRTWCAKREASHPHPGVYRHLHFMLRMLVLFDDCGCACVWSGCAERVLHAHVAVDRLPHSRLLRPISLCGRKCGDTCVMHNFL